MKIFIIPIVLLAISTIAYQFIDIKNRRVANIFWQIHTFSGFTGLLALGGAVKYWARC